MVIKAIPMLQLKLDPMSHLMETVTIDNDCLVKAVIALPDNEYIEIVKGILDKSELTADRLLVLFSYCWRLIQKHELNPAQANALNSFIKNLKEYECETKFVHLL